jgi:hypothetical protein
VLLCFLVVCQCQPGPKGPPHRPTKRTFDINVDKNNLRIRAKFQNGTEEDEFAMNCGLGNGPDHLVNFHLTYSTKVAGNKTGIDLAFTVIKVLEFFSSDNQTVYQGDERVIFSSWPADKEKFKWNQWADDSGVVNGVNNYKYTVDNGIFTMSVQMASSDLTLKNGLAIDPNSIKIDIGLTNYPYGANPPFPTRLALQSQIMSKTTSKHEGSRALVDHKLSFDSSPDMPLGAVSWIPSANIVDPITEFPVVAWSPETQKGNKFDVYFTFVTPASNLHPVSIYWDPTVGLDYGSDQPSEFCLGGSICGALAYGILGGAGGVALILLIVIVVFVARRNKKRDIDYSPIS